MSHGSREGREKSRDACCSKKSMMRAEMILSNLKSMSWFSGPSQSAKVFCWIPSKKRKERGFWDFFATDFKVIVWFHQIHTCHSWKQGPAQWLGSIALESSQLALEAILFAKAVRGVVYSLKLPLVSSLPKAVYTTRTSLQIVHAA